ncbi:unnamed protein product [Caenorhabditis auriculariae]|uniref:Uncharacterized protein n=1 Tax=Caenorhabditis auriculariae TaxID=2777116 RepID=A0A8S1HI77_9PELO|nr:unnamed protein product [Caenorhabditis auriculariae]
MSTLQKRLDAYSAKLATLEEVLAKVNGIINKLFENESIAEELSRLIKKFNIEKEGENIQAEAKNCPGKVRRNRQVQKNDSGRKSGWFAHDINADGEEVTGDLW